MAWEFLLLLPLMYTATLMPYLLLVASDEVGESTWVLVLETIVTLSFALDIIINFNLAYYSPSRQAYCVNRCSIATRYLRTWFLLDFIATFPLELLSTGGSSTRFARLGRLQRVTRIARLARLMKCSKPLAQGIRFQSRMCSPAFLRMVKIFFFSLLAAHILGSLWHFIAYEDPQGGWLVVTGETL